jgi:hypothetical protein
MFRILFGRLVRANKHSVDTNVLRDRFYFNHHFAEGIQKQEDGCTWRIDYGSIEECKSSWLRVQRDGWFEK